jgi:replicative DNA helicase
MATAKQALEPQFDQQMPANLDAERSILGAILLNNTCFFQACETLPVDDFQNSSHRVIYAAMNDLAGDGKPIDFVTVMDWVMANGGLSKVGGAGYLTSLTDGMPRVSNVSNYVAIIHECAMRRRLILSLQRYRDDAFDKAIPIEQLVSTVDGEIMRILADEGKQTFLPVGEVVPEVQQYIKQMREEQRQVVGLPSGIRELDEATTGLRRGEVTLIGGWAGSGKSALALQIAGHNAYQKHPVGFFSAEMNRQELALRLVSQITNIDFMRLRNPSWIPHDRMGDVANALAAIKKLPILVDDSPSLEKDQLIARSRQMVSKGCELIVYDYVQKFRVRGERDPRLIINAISEAIREFAKSAKVPVLSLSQLTRPKDGLRRPTMFDLKESGNLEQDAHVVILPYRPKNSDDKHTGEDELVIGKQRSGPTGPIPVKFSGGTLKYESREPVVKQVSTSKQKPSGKSKAAEPEERDL